MQKQNYYTNLKSFTVNSDNDFGKLEIVVDRESRTITMEQRGEQPIMPGAEMNWNGFSLVDFEHQDENTRFHKYTAELNEHTAAFAKEIRKKALNNITPENYEATTEYPESEALSKAGWEWVRYQDGSGGFHDEKRLSPYDIGYDATTNEGWLKDKNRNETDFFYRTGYDDEGVEIFDLEKFKAVAEEKIAKLLNIDIEQENAMEKQNEQTLAQKAATNFVLDKLAQAGIEVITDKGEMREILNSGKFIQTMAAYHGTSHEGEIDNAFNGFGTYVVSVNTDVAKEQGMKIASKKYGDAFYIKSNGQEQTLDKFLSEHGYSSYWNELLKQTHFDDVAKLQHEIIASDTKGNAELESQKTNLSVLLSAGVIEYKREKTYLYSIDIPDNNGKNYLFYEKSIGLDAANNINAALEKMGVEWRVDRRDAGRQVYFNTLSEKVFNGNQEQTSKFLKDIGYAGMEMNSSNYIIFDEKDIVVNERVQYMMGEKGEVYGFACDGKVYLDPDLMNSNTPVHEYTHIWDKYTQETNPELWEKGKAILQQTRLWQEVVNDPNYANIADDEDLVLSEVHSRICGKMAEKVLEQIAAQDGEIARDRAIDWDKETWEYIKENLYDEIWKNKDYPLSTQQEFEAIKYFRKNEPSLDTQLMFSELKDFLAMPMQDFMNGKNITQGITKEQSVQKMVSNEVSENSDFFNAVEDYVKKGIKPFHNEFLLKNTPAILQYAEIPNHEIVLSTGVINKAKKTHNLSDEEILSALKGLSDPILIFDSDKEKSEAKENSVLIFTETSDKNGHPVAIGFEMSAQRKEMKTEFIINQIHSIHPRTTLINSNNENMLEKWTEKGLMKYVDDKKISGWLGDRRVQFPLTLTKPDEITITDKDGNVNTFSVKTKSGYEKNVSKNNTIQMDVRNTESINSQLNDFVDTLRDSDKAIEEATNGMGHDPTDDLPLDFEPPMDNAEMEMKDETEKEEFEIAEPEGQVELIIPDSVRVAIYESEATSIMKTEYGDSYIMKSQEIYANEICSILEKFSQENSADWNIEAHDKTSIYHLMAVAGTNELQREQSVEKIKEYFTTEVYASEKEQLGEMFSKIIETKTNNGYDFNFSTKQEEIENPAKEHETDEKEQKAAVMKEMLEKMGIKDGKVPEFAMLTQSGLKAYKDMSIAGWNPTDQTYTLAKFEKTMVEGKDVQGNTVTVEKDVAVEKVVVTPRALKELISQPRIEQARQFDENTPEYKKMLETQYQDFFKPRDNTANNLRHNLSVYCRKESNTPLDALKIANELIKRMPTEERRKTKELLNKLRGDGETVNQVLVNTYLEAVKAVPLNERYFEQTRHEKIIARPMYDTISGKGEQIDSKFNLRIGDSVNNIAFKVGKTFGIGKEKLYQNCTIVSASKEGNVVTLMDGDKSYYNVPRDTFLKQYAKQQKQEQKQEKRQKNIMRLDIER